MRLLLAAANRASIVLLAALLAGCSNPAPGSQALPPGTSGAANRPAAPWRQDAAVQFAYVANFGSNDVSAYSIAASGALTPVPGSPFKAGTYP